MRIVLLTDLHANREALEACLDHAGRHKADRYVFLGDFVGYGADPGWVVDTVMAHVEKGAVAVQGNHDAAALAGARSTMIEDARRAIEWTRAHLDDRHLDFLRELPLSVEDGDRMYVHANAWAPAQWDYVTRSAEAARSMHATSCRYTFCGHMHEPMLYHMGGTGRASSFVPVAGSAIPVVPPRKWLAIPGSVGQPRDGNPAACYAVFDDARLELTYYRVAYDVEAAARKITEAGLPRELSVRLERGY